MPLQEAIILAGGLGTRLRSVVPDLPKCMAPVDGKPFLTFVIDHLLKQKINHFIFSLGYRSEAIVSFLEKDFHGLSYTVCLEEEPLGTGGAIKKACNLSKDESVLVANGDTLFAIDVDLLSAVHDAKEANCSLSLKPMQNFNRYGVVEIDHDNQIKSFKEKQFYENGFINGGVYALQKDRFLMEDLPEKFSFEKDYLEQFYTKTNMFGVVQDQYFIDIGIPEDFARAQEELRG